MTKRMQISLKPGERIFLNGAVVRVDRKVTLELLNDVTFLMESHVLQVEDTTTPLRQLYFAIQTMLIDPRGAEVALVLIANQLASLMALLENESMLASLQQVSLLVGQNRLFEALRVTRSLFPVEEKILGGEGVQTPPDARATVLEITL